MGRTLFIKMDFRMLWADANMKIVPEGCISTFWPALPHKKLNHFNGNIFFA
jgi:hypothetical protein